MVEQSADLAPASRRWCGSTFGWATFLMTLYVPVAAANDLSTASQPQGTTLSSGRTVIASGGGTSTGGNYAIDGTIGQADADPLQPSTGGTFAITGGFWFTAVPTPYGLFNNGFENE